MRAKDAEGGSARLDGIDGSGVAVVCEGGGWKRCTGWMRFESDVMVRVRELLHTRRVHIFHGPMVIGKDRRTVTLPVMVTSFGLDEDAVRVVFTATGSPIS